MTLNLEDVFVTEGVPEYTFVRPPNYVDILLDVRKAGKPVIIEGQSGTGKTTSIKRIIQEVGWDTAAYLTARQPVDIEQIEQIAPDRTEGVLARPRAACQIPRRLPRTQRRGGARLAVGATVRDDATDQHPDGARRPL